MTVFYEDRNHGGTPKDCFFLLDKGSLVNFQFTNMQDGTFELEIHVYDGSDPKDPGERTSYILYGPRIMFEELQEILRAVLSWKKLV